MKREKSLYVYYEVPLKNVQEMQAKVIHNFSSFTKKHHVTKSTWCFFLLSFMQRSYLSADKHLVFFARQ
jgi:hypothetical protein